MAPSSNSDDLTRELTRNFEVVDDENRGSMCWQHAELAQRNLALELSRSASGIPRDSLFFFFFRCGNFDDVAELALMEQLTDSIHVVFHRRTCA
ncbi:hypothetical protein CCACVL1_07730 [Corchorus capsularis]|uniref:Uncharacterized protein n=1 Tax=Corchorus capsularis TaxID=210143 RepID=A0A1R3J464_COCAP|nr:hypothetical protein CCACVL1_07730 [Corchorus capsularis]